MPTCDSFDRGKCIFDLMPSNVDLILKVFLSKSNAGNIHFNLLHRTQSSGSVWDFTSAATCLDRHTDVCYVRVCELQHCIFFLLPSLPRSISRATHGSSQNEIILHHSVGTWKANLQPGRQLITSFPKPLCRSVIKTNWSSQWNGTLKYGCIRKQIL